LARSGPEARALRDIYGFVRARNVVSTGLRLAAGKVANWEDVEEIAAALRERHDPSSVLTGNKRVDLPKRRRS
jgi:predicted component of type VI protein secretion system